MTNTPCTYCVMTTTGEHEQNCPLYKGNINPMITIRYEKLSKAEHEQLNNYGWICPRCQSVWNPSVYTCTCTVPTYSSTSSTDIYITGTEETETINDKCACKACTCKNGGTEDDEQK
jgi:hypothetical protein